MANRYWVGGTGTWSDATNHWASTSGGSPSVANLPTASDNVYFDLNSFSVYGQSITLDLASASTLCKDMDWTGVTNFPSLLANGAYYRIRVSGSLTMSTDMAVGEGVWILFMPNNTSKTINTYGKEFESFYFNSVGGGSTDIWTLNSDITLNAVFEFNTSGGTLNIGNYNIISPEEFWIEPDDGAYDQTLTAGNMTVTTEFFHIDGANVTDSTSNMSLVIQNRSNITGGVISGGFAIKDITISPSVINSSSSFALSISGNNSFRNFSASYEGLDLTITLTSGSTQTISGTLDLLGGDGNLLYMHSSVANSIATLAVTGAKTADYVKLKDITLTGGTCNVGKHSIDGGHNSGWFFYISALQDRFNDATINPYLWTSPFGYYDASGNTLNLYTGTASEYSGISSASSYNLVGSEIYCELVDRGSQDLSMFEASPLQLLKTSSPTNDKLFWYVNGTLIKAYKTVAGVQTEVASTTYEANNFKWLKIREDSGTFYFDRSENGIVWTNFGSCTGSDMSSCLVQPFAGTYADGDYNSQISLDNFNTLPQEKVEIKFENNLIVDSDRSTWITEISSTLLYLSYYSFEARTTGLGYLEVGDRLTAYDTEGREFEVLVLDIDVTVGSGIQETIKSDLPIQNTTDYDTAGIIGKTIRNTEIKVNKQEGEITLLSSQVEGLSTSTSTLTVDANAIRALVETANNNIGVLQTDVADLQLTSDALTLSISQTGGTNLLKNAVGLKGDIKEWQTLDENGDPVDARNAGAIISSMELADDTYGFPTQANSSESRNFIVLIDTFIERTVPTIVGEKYTVFFRYFSTGNASLSLTGVIGTINIAGTMDVTPFKYQFTATSVNTTIRIENTTGLYIFLTDIVLKKGDAGGWVQAPNEIYGTGFRFDRDGFSIDKTDSYFKSLLTNEYIAVYNTSSGSDKVVWYVSKDSAKITNLYTQDLLQLQRYNNPAKAARFIPTPTGLMLVINN